MPEHKQKAFKQDYGNFYELSQQEASKLDYNKLYAASRDVKPAKEDPLKNLPNETKQPADFKSNTKKFFDVKQSETSSVYKADQGRFFAVDSQKNHEKVTQENTIGEKFNNISQIE